MIRKLTLVLAAFGVASCSTVPSPQPVATNAGAAPTTLSARTGFASYDRVARKIEPVAETVCRQFSSDLPSAHCNFRITVDKDPRQAPNAFQSIGRDGRPVITFNVNMLKSIKNDQEIAFIMGHEAGHQIARHLIQKQSNATAGALLGAILVGAAGGNPQAGADLGGFVGAQSYSKSFELQADRIGAHIAMRAGYNPLIGAKSFERTQGSNDLLSTHPPGADRYQTVVNTVAEINRFKAKGQLAPVKW